MMIWYVIQARWKLTLCRRWQFIGLLVAPLLTFWAMTQFLERGSEELQVPVVFVSETESPMVETIIKRISRNETIRVIQETKEEARRLVETNQAEAAVIFKKDFADRVQRGKMKASIQFWVAPNAISTGLIEEYVAGEVIRLASHGKAATYLTTRLNQPEVYQEVWQYAEDQWHPKPLMTIQEQQDVKTSHSITAVKTRSDASPFLYGLLSIYILLICFFLNSWLLEERTNGLASRCTLFGVPTVTRLTSSFIGILLLTMITLVPVTIYLMDRNDPWLYISGLTFAYVIACTGISFLVGNLLNSPLLYHLVAIGLTTVTGVLGGSFIRLNELSDRLVRASELTPQYWFLQGIQEHIYGQEFIILVSIGLCAMILGVGIGVIRHDRA